LREGLREGFSEEVGRVQFKQFRLRGSRNAPLLSVLIFGIGRGKEAFSLFKSGSAEVYLTQDQVL